MIYLDDLKYMKLYKKPFMLPINKVIGGPHY